MSPTNKDPYLLNKDPLAQRKDPYPPLVSSRSPSYERARHELENPSPTTDPELIATLNRLVEAEDNALAIYQAGADAARDPALREQLEILGASHAVHLRALEDAVTVLGAAAPRRDERSFVLTRRASDIRYLQSDAEIVAAMAGSIDELSAQYDDALARPSMAEQARSVIAQHRAALRKEQARLVGLARQETRL